MSGVRRNDRGRAGRSGLRRSAPALGIVLALLAGCASRRPAATEPPAPAALEPQVQAEAQAEADAAELEQRLGRLYADLERIVEEHQSGVDLIVGGDEVLGEGAQDEALNRLARRVRECDTTPECNRSRVHQAYQALLGGQGIALKTQAVKLAALRSDIEEDTEREPGTASFVSAMPEIAHSVSLLRGTELRDIISLNGPVSAALDDWLTWMRPLLMSSYENYQFLRAEIAPVYEEAGLPEALLFAMMATETGGKVHAFSRAGAAGPLQFMRFTGRRYGLDVEDGFDMRLDPVAAVRANAAYLNEHFELFDHSLEKVLGAYNGGESRMKGLHGRLKGASFWDSRLYYSLPSETRDYVPRILAAAWLFMHPEDYNLEFPMLDTRMTDLVVQDDTSLGELTICLGQADNTDGWFRTLRNLNPRLEPGDRVRTGESLRVPERLVRVYEERCRGTLIAQNARKLHDANYPDRPEMVPYTVRNGDTLGKIASRLHCASLGELADLNRIRPPRYVIHVGQKIKLPTCTTR